jgi:predicted deacylase
VTLARYGSAFCDLDLDSDGRRFGNIYFEHSDDRHAQGFIPVPIAVLRNGEGPTVLLSAGVHGDEYEGQIILRNLLHSIEKTQMTGRIIALPALNAPSVAAASRVSPLDGGNLNRAFPGATDRGPTALIAGFVTERLLPLCNVALDLHSGGKAANYVDCAYLCAAADRALHGKLVEMAEWFGAPYTFVAPGGGEPAAFDPAAHARGVPLLSAELGGGGGVSVASLAAGWRGTLDLLGWAGVLARGADPPPGTQFLRFEAPGHYVVAPWAGLFEPACDLGATVEAGQVAGYLHRLDALSAAPLPIEFAAAGVIVSRRAPATCLGGDWLYLLGSPIDRGEALAAT